MPHRHAFWLLILIVAGVVAGIAGGWFLGPAMLEIKWLGDLFLNALKMLILPLIVAAVISGVASLGDVRRLGRLGRVTVLYYVATTALAVAIGLLVVNLLQPGAGMAVADAEMPERVVQSADTGLSDILLSLISPNLVASAADYRLLPLITFAILFAAALSTLGRTGAPVLAFFEGVNAALMKLVVWLMYLAPIGIFALVGARLGMAGGGAEFARELAALGYYVVTVLAGLALHVLALLAIMWLLARRRFDYVMTMLRALLTAFGTASSTATLPLTMECAREAGLDERSVRFVLPLGSTVNMNGTALYEAVAALFIAQAYGIDLSMGQQALVLVTATLAAIGAAGIPEAGLVTMVIVLQAVGLPLEGIGLLLAVDWFLDRFRTAVNVWGDAVGAAYVSRRMEATPGDVPEPLAEELGASGVTR